MDESSNERKIRNNNIQKVYKSHILRRIVGIRLRSKWFENVRRRGTGELLKNIENSNLENFKKNARKIEDELEK